MGKIKNKLIKQAINASRESYAPYSKYRVGAAILGESGKIYSGCNVENASYGATICAERTAAVKAVSEGETKFIAIAIHGYSELNSSSESEYAFPCGICRQVLNEFCDPTLLVLLVSTENDYLERSLGELLPDGFGPANLNNKL
ncbi:MAG: cytidine deaminase [Bacillota bacterium]|nr:cytidine deaminase [Bacillota bacterium]